MPERLDHLPLPPPESEPHRVVTGPRGDRRLPSREPVAHARAMKSELVGLEAEFKRVREIPKPASSVGFLFTGTFAEESDPNAGGLADARSGSFLVDEVSGRALVHNHFGNLGRLRSKIDKYGDPERTTKAGLTLNAPLVAPLESLRLATITDLSDGWLRPDALDLEARLWVEVWAGGGHLGTANERERVRHAIAEFIDRQSSGSAADIRSFAVAEHDIYLVELSGAALMELPVQLPDVYHVTPPEQPIVPRLLDSQSTIGLPDIGDPPSDASTVAILDTGIAERHPLLETLMLSPGASAIPGDNSAADSHGHGTRMAGLAAYPELAGQLTNGGPVRPRCNLQNGRLIAGDDGPEPEFMLERTENAILDLEAVQTPRRIFSLSVGARTRNPGDGTAWGVAVDQLAFDGGNGRLICVAAGNRPLRGLPSPNDYPAANLVDGLTSPAEALNALTVGAVTDLHRLEHDDGNRLPLAAAGELCPVACCDIGGRRAIKPDVVVEGGNLSSDGNTCLHDRGLQILTTGHRHGTGDWLASTGATSAATATVAGMLADIWRANPRRRPETVRALLIHSARWTTAMRSQFSSDADRRRAFGYGKPSAELASWSERVRPTLILEDMIYPEKQFGDGREMHFLQLPMPDEALRELGDTRVDVAVTLSYFLEPNETRVVRYASAGLRWALQRSVESVQDFRKRINRLERDRDPQYETTAEDLPWEIGPDARSRGTIQSDRATVMASELVGGRAIAVWPVFGWWRDRGVRQDAGIPYSLVITLDAGENEVDLYSPILNEVSIRTEVR